MKRTKLYYKELVYAANGVAIKVHEELGSGLLESVYHKCLIHELKHRNISFKSGLKIPVVYKNLELDADIKCDIFIENDLVVGLKAVESVLPVYEAQLLTYMKLLKVPMDLLINFNCINIFKEGQKTYVN